MSFQNSQAFLTPLPLKTKPIITSSIHPQKSNRTTPSAHLRRRPQPLPPPNTGYGSKDQPVKSVRYPHLTLFTRVWEPIHPPTAGLIIIPGLQWHSGWFSTIAVPLCKHGIRVVAVDPLSTGRSDDISGIRGYIAHIDDHLDDIHAALDQLINHLPKASPVFVLSESSGGVLSCLLAKRPGVAQNIRAWILCAPAITVAPEVLPPQPLIKMLLRLGKRFPKLPTPGQRISGDTYDKAFGDGISQDLSKGDPHVLYKVPLRMGTTSTMLRAMQAIEKSLEERTLWMREVLVLHNRLDKRTLFSGSQALVDRVVTEHGARLVDPGGRAHQLFQERIAVIQETVKTILEFVEEARARS